MSGQKIIEGLEAAAAGDFSSVTVKGQRWVRAPEWQPIASAPKDETVFIIGRDGSERHPYVGVAQYASGHFREPGDFPARRWASPTHWQPLPEPPVSA